MPAAAPSREAAGATTDAQDGATGVMAAADKACSTLLERNGAPITKAELATLGQAIDAALAAKPGEPRWLLGRALVLRQSGNPKDAAALLKQVTAKRPNDPHGFYFLAMSLFESIGPDAGLDAMSISDDARTALNTTLQLDPHYVWARYALSQFYIQAPGIAGGSYRKAREQAKLAMEEPDNRGDFIGRMILAQVAENDEEWDDMTREYLAAADAKGVGANAAWPLSSLVNALVTKKEDTKAARPVLDRLKALPDADPVTIAFAEGEIARREKRLADALAEYEKVLAARPEARQSRWYAAECAEKLGDRARAAENYRQFAERFPKDDRASKAAKKARELSK